MLFFPPVLLPDIKISRWFLWFVAFARGHAVMKVLAFLARLVKELCLMPHWFGIFQFFLLYGPHLAANTLAAQPAPGDVLNSRTERFSGWQPLVEK